MAQRNVAKLVGDDARHLVGADLAIGIFAIEAARDEDAPVRRGKPVHRIDLVDIAPSPARDRARRQAFRKAGAAADRQARSIAHQVRATYARRKTGTSQDRRPRPEGSAGT